MTFKINTLGCKVNTYESNLITEHMRRAGYELTKDEQVDITIINTCTVTNTADRKSMKIIRHAAKNSKIVVVVGCMSQYNCDEVKKVENVKIVLGNKYKSRIPELLEDTIKTNKQIIMVEDLKDTEFETMSLENFNRTRAFVKIQDGCNNFCSFCIIPYIRGNVRSKDPLDVIDEVKMLVKNGHKEIVLTGIHTGHYGSEFSDYNFSNLISNLVKINGLERLRISSIEMNEITDEFLDLLSKYDVLVDHMHIPIQTGCDKVLKEMNRKYSVEDFKDKIIKLRNIRSDISITTDLVVGYPTETEEDFKKTVQTMKDLEFSNIHVFPYSKRNGTVSSELKDLNGNIKKNRVREILTLNKELSSTYMNKFIGRTMEFIPETYKDGYIIGHTGNFLLVKTKGTKEQLHKLSKVTLSEVQNGYMIGSKE